MLPTEILITTVTSVFSAILSVIVGYLVYLLQQSDKRRNAEHERHKQEERKKEERRNTHDRAVEAAVQCILRDRLIHLINKSVEEGQAPVFTVENVNKMYESYHTLEGNGTIDQLYEHFRDLPTREPPKKESVIEVHAG